jgi:ribulose-phosphate 3-epimerase
MSLIAPAILAENLDQYKEQIDKVSGFTERAHIDVSDGIFAPSVTVKPDEIWWPEDWEVDIHAMIMNPTDYLQTLISLKPSMVIIHAEAQGELGSVMQTFKQYDIKAGLALLRHTVPQDVEQLIKLADHVMVFTGDLGRYGGKASLMQLEKVRLIKQINPMAEIGWDGGVAIDNAYTLTQGGVNVLNSGGAIQQAPDAKVAYDLLVQEINKKGVI